MKSYLMKKSTLLILTILGGLSMAATPSTMLALGTKAPDFSLPSQNGKVVTLSSFENSRALLVIFMCNHCPFVKHVRSSMLDMVKEYQHRGVAVVAISSNDADAYPQDGPEQMAKEAQEHKFTFHYLYDETQSVAKAYKAACTPDFFLFDKDRSLVYRGQMDDSRPGNNIPSTGKDLRAALDALLSGNKVSSEQKPSIGCSIKWKKNNEPKYGSDVIGKKL